MSEEDGFKVASLKVVAGIKADSPSGVLCVMFSLVIAGANRALISSNLSFFACVAPALTELEAIFCRVFV